MSLTFCESGGSDSDAEEWDRAAQFDDGETAGDQSRSKERLWESEESQPWEKGGSGLVFHTDAATWNDAEGDEMEQWADEWDVDTDAAAAGGEIDRAGRRRHVRV